MGYCDWLTGKSYLPFMFFVFCIILQQNKEGVLGKRTCLFDVCTFLPGNCMNGGTCRMNNDCLPDCDCVEGFSGSKCQIVGNETNPCTNECEILTCNLGGDCFQDQDTCNISCVCYSGYEGDFCERKDQDPCFPLICKNGHCNTSIPSGVMCVCDKGWIGDMCNTECTRNCSQGHCSIYREEETCICPPGFTSASNCTEEIEELTVAPIELEQGLPLPYLVFVILFPIILLVAFIGVVYFMWKKRMIFVMKIVYYLQKYEDSDGKEYDAFLSFRSARDDEYWVLNTLFPKLEHEMGFRVCIHYRDFLAGETISNNIIDAIDKSRRTIIVVSPEYANGEWTRMEYQVAQQEMLSLRHKIIPIMFKDIDSVPDLDKNLKFILNSITYIKWPTSSKKTELEKFWEQLRLTMPKKKEVKSDLKGGVVINEYSADTRF